MQIKSDSLFQKISLVTGFIVLAVLFRLLFLKANIEIKDVDLWLHLAMGKFILTHGYIPSVDVLSFSIAGQPWVNHEWLFQVIVQLVYQAGGADGLIGMQVVIVCTTMILLLLMGYSKERQLLSSVLLILVYFNYYQRFTIRPDLFSLLFLLIFFFVLSMWLNRTWSVAILFLVQALWSNIHGFFFWGPLVVMLAMLGEWLKRNTKLPFEWNRQGRLSDGEFKQLKLILAAVVVACFANPQTVQGALYPLKTLLSLTGSSGLFFEKIQELQRPLTWQNWFLPEPYGFFKLMIVLSAASFVCSYRRIDVGVLILWLVMLIFSLAANRNLVYFSFVAFFVCTVNFLNFSIPKNWSPPFMTQDRKHLVVIFLNVILMFSLIDHTDKVSRNGYFNFDNYTRKSEYGGVSLRNFPYKAADFLVKNKIKGNFFNDFNSGAYLLGRCFPDIKVFIDGRTEVYGSEFFHQYSRIWKGDVGQFEKIVNQKNVTGAFLSYLYVPAPEELMRYLYRSPHWALVYFDYDASVFLRRIPENQALIEKLAIDLSLYQAKSLDLIRVGTMKLTPYQNVNRAQALFSFGLYDAALAESFEALKILPDYGAPYKVIGEVYLKKGDYAKALENLRIAKNFDPLDYSLRYFLSLAYQGLGNSDEAIKQCLVLLGDQPANAKGLYLLTKLYAGEKQFDNSWKTLKYAYPADPQDGESLQEIADIFFENKQFEPAKEIYLLALESNKDSAKIHYQLGLCFNALGLTEFAEKHFEASNQIPSNN